MGALLGLASALCYTGLGMMFLYRGLSRSDMSVVVPVSAVGGVALPVLAGVLLLGDRPPALSWLGVAVAVPALWLVSRAGSSARLVSASRWTVCARVASAASPWVIARPRHAAWVAPPDEQNARTAHPRRPPLQRAAGSRTRPDAGAHWSATAASAEAAAGCLPATAPCTSVTPVHGRPGPQSDYSRTRVCSAGYRG